MVKKYVSYTSVICVLLVVVFLGMVTHKAEARPPVGAGCPAGMALEGWLWSSNIGWISVNSETAGGAPSGSVYCVSLDVGTGNLVGWAWSPNVGWIKFGGFPDNVFPTIGTSAKNAKNVGNQIQGWVRACAGTISGDCTSNTSRTDGWDGWIELSGARHLVQYTKNTGTMDGFAWGSHVMGWISFHTVVAVDSGQEPPVCSTPPCSGGASPSICTLESEPLPNSQTSFKLRWNAPTEYFDSCTGSNFSTSNQMAGSVDVTPPAGGQIYSLSCKVKGVTPAQTKLCQYSRTLGSVAPVEDGMKLTVTDSRYGTISNASAGTIRQARVEKGKKFILNGTASEGYDFPRLESDADCDENDVGNPRPICGTNFDPNIVGQDQEVIQTKQSVVYRIRDNNNNGTITQVGIRVIAVDPQLQEI